MSFGDNQGAERFDEALCTYGDSGVRSHNGGACERQRADGQKRRVRRLDYDVAEFDGRAIWSRAEKFADDLRVRVQLARSGRQLNIIDTGNRRALRSLAVKPAGSCGRPPRGEGPCRLRFVANWTTREF